MTRLMLALLLLGLASVTGCSPDSEALKKAQAESEAAKIELAKVKAEADAANAELAILKTKLAGQGGNAPSGDQAIKNTVWEFYKDLNFNRVRSAYDSTSVGYKMRTDRKEFDRLVEKHGILLRVNVEPGFTENNVKVRKLAKDNAVECDTMGITGSNIVLRLVQEGGAWKIDDFVEIREKKS